MLGNLLKKRKNPLIGVDIGCSTVKLLELSRVGRKLKVEGYVSQKLDEHAVLEKNITSVESVGESIYTAASNMQRLGADAAVAVSGSSVITKTIDMSASLTDAEMESQIVVEADQYIPYPLDEVAIDFERQRISPRNEQMVEVLLAACKKDNVDLRVEALESGGLNAKVVDIEAYAIERAYGLLQEQMGLDEHKIVAIVDIGATLITFYILNDGVSVYSREQLFGGTQLVEKVINLYGYSRQEAEKAIREENLPDGYESDVLYPFKEEITENVSRALQFFFSSSQYNDVDLIVLAGGVASIDGLDELVQDSLSTSTIVADPFADMLIDSKVDKEALRKDASSLMLACGLAMRGLK